MSRFSSDGSAIGIPTACTVSISDVPATITQGVVQYTDVSGLAGTHAAAYDAAESAASGYQTYTATITITATRYGWPPVGPITDTFTVRVRMFESGDVQYFNAAFASGVYGVVTGASAGVAQANKLVRPSGQASVLSAYDGSLVGKVSPSGWNA